MNPQCKRKNCEGFIETTEGDPNYGICNRCGLSDVQMVKDSLEAEKVMCVHCKEHEALKPQAIYKQESYGGFVLFHRPLCEGCLNDLKTKSLDELFPF